MKRQTIKIRRHVGVWERASISLYFRVRFRRLRFRLSFASLSLCFHVVLWFGAKPPCCPPKSDQGASLGSRKVPCEVRGCRKLSLGKSQAVLSLLVSLLVWCSIRTWIQKPTQIDPKSMPIFSILNYFFNICSWIFRSSEAWKGLLVLKV